ncbi:MAG TPA: polysaccharide deacetylase family protein [Thermomicrobiales bacterium]|nr:polysaccharide deacetylase family protein [Thermomicrobiales bacterium]
MSRSALVLLAVLVSTAFATRPIPGAAAPGEAGRSLASANDCWADPSGAVYVPETGHHIYEPFLSTWRQYDLALVGYPLSEPLERDGMTVQYFERARFEHHPEHAGTPYEVLLALLGHRAAAGHPNQDAFATRPPDAPPEPAARYYPETGHYLAAPFQEYWDANGGLPLFGYPLSEAFEEEGRLVQYFERARFEHHPEHAGTRYEIELGHLGRVAAEEDGIEQGAVEREEGVPDYTWRPEPQARRIPTLMYHHFGAPASRYQVTYWDFEQQLIWLRDNGYTPITMTAAYAGVFGAAELPEKPVVITFDDGLASQWEAAALLDQYGYPGVFFVHPDSPLTHDQLRDLAARGHEIGSHSSSHPFLTLVSNEQLWQEVSASREALARITGAPIDFFAYPYGDWNGQVVAAVQAAGYCGAVHAWGGAMWTPENRWAEPRIEISGDLSLHEFAMFVSGAWQRAQFPPDGATSRLSER